MTATDWSHVDSNGLSILHSSSAVDLFGGDLFGDELMDMYNSDVIGSDEHSNEIPTLLLSSGELEISMSKASTHIAAQVAGETDDGLGAFRPSTSFNDFSSLLTSSPAVVGSESIEASPPDSTRSTKESGRKRSTAEDPHAGPTSKKRTSSSKPCSPEQNTNPTIPTPTLVTSAPQTTGSISVGHVALKVKNDQTTLPQNRNGKAGTPNPLLSAVPIPPLVCKRANAVTSVAMGTTTELISSRVVATVTNVTSSSSEELAVGLTSVVSEVTPQESSSSLAKETDFTSIAQAAVSNLILNAGANTDGIRRAATTSIGVDLSTAHIKALTSTNWVTACSDGDGSPLDTSADAKANRARRQNLNPDERARQNRDRNREHARNTRLRKKAYVEELKRALTELVSQRDTNETEKRLTVQRELEQREVRFRVMEEFLKLRGRNEPNFARWIAILEDSFTLTLPFTTFRAMTESKMNVTRPSSRAVEQLFRGAAEVMDDAKNMSAFLQTLGNENTTDASITPVTLMYHCDRKNFFMDGCAGVLVWTAYSVGAVKNGAPYELSLKGNMRAKFSPASNKLLSAEIQFDTGSVVDQLQDLVVPMIDNDHMDSDLCDGVAAAAQAAANEADALLDSLQMPQLGGSVPAAITVASETRSAAVSVTSSDKSDCSSDESLECGKLQAVGCSGVSTRRNVRRPESTNFVENV